MLKQEGRLVRWAVALQVRRNDGRFRDVVRYDDWHGYLHRHDPTQGGRPGKSVPVPLAPNVDPVIQAVADLEVSADKFIDLARTYEDLEVSDDDDDESTD
jgi:hypothetical protein